MAEKIKLYQDFIDTNPKYSSQIFSFIKRNCIIANFKINHLESIRVGKEKGINLAILRDCKLFFDNENKCKNCNLCDRFIFKEKRELLKNSIKKLLKKETNDFKKEKILNNLAQELSLISYHIKKDIKDKFYKTTLLKNLYQRIINTSIDDIIKKLNKKENVDDFFCR